MRSKCVCGIVLLAFVCVVLADEEINKDFNGETENDVKDIDYNVLFQPGEVVIPTGPTIYCTRDEFRCKSGDQCIPIAWKCDCAYDCTDGSDEINCDNECLTTLPPKEVTTSGPTSSPGTVIPQKHCQEGDKLCGDGQTCIPGLLLCDGVEDCPDGSDEKHGCHCDCGEYSKSCSYVKGVKKCICWDAYEDKLGTCTLCWCKGYSSMYGCHFDNNGNIKCPCLKGYAQLGEECKKCDCGSHGNCTLYGWGSKSCRCEKRYSEYDGTCRECNCGENGTCGFRYGYKVCSCKKGFEEYKGTCKECDCGDFSYCKFDSNGNKECTCYDGYAMNAGVCTACNCNPGKSCIFKGAIEKECICPHGYDDIGGMCAVCDCRMDDSNCTLNLKSDFQNGIKTCHCPKGYTSDNNFVDPSCIDINECLRPQDNDCPFSTECVNTPGSYHCVCANGFKPIFNWNYDIKKLGCQDIDECEKSYACYSMYARCVNTPGSYRCDCKPGYSVEKSVRGLEKDNRCVENARPWRTASIVLGTLFGIVIFVLLMAICVKNDIIQ